MIAPDELHRTSDGRISECLGRLREAADRSKLRLRCASIRMAEASNERLEGIDHASFRVGKSPFAMLHGSFSRTTGGTRLDGRFAPMEPEDLAWSLVFVAQLCYLALYPRDWVLTLAAGVLLAWVGYLAYAWSRKSADRASVLAALDPVCGGQA
jgi:hypothetical protein